MKYKFEDIIHNVTAKKKPTEEDKYSYIALEHIDSENLNITRWGSDVAPSGEKIVIKKGDVLFGKRRAYQKKVAISPIDGIFSAHGMAFRPKEDVICKEFLPFFISSDTFLNEAIRISVGGLSPTINWKDIKELKFDLPPIEEQKRLSEKLWAAYEVKQSYINMIAATDEMVKSQFIEMFKDTKRERLGDFCTTHARIGWQKLTRAEFLDMGDYYLITGWDIMDDHTVDFSKCKYVSKERYEQDPKLIMREDDVLLTKDGTLGKVAIVRGLDKPATLNGHIFVIRSKDGRIIPEFLIGLFTSNEFICQLNDNKVGSTIAGITQKSLLEFQIPVATIEEQLDFVSIMKQADKSKSELRKSIESINKVIKSLINENL